MDNLDFLDGPTPEQTAAPEQVPEPVAVEAPQPSTDGPPRGPDGKFAPKAPVEAAPAVAAEPQAPATPPEAAPQPQAPAPHTPPDGFVPIGVVQAMREELNALKRQPQQPPQPAPDPYEDFEAYQAHQENQQALERAEWSRQLAEVKYDPETVSKAQEWAAGRFDADPAFRQRALSTRDPYGFAIEEYQRDQALSLLSDPRLLEQFRAWQSGNAPMPTSSAPMSVAAPPQPPTPPRSLASAPNAGGGKPGITSVGPGDAFASVFGT